MGQHIPVKQRLLLNLVGIEVLQLIADDVNGVYLLVDGGARPGDLRPEHHRGLLGGEAASRLIRAEIDHQRLTMQLFQVLICCRDEFVSLDVVGTLHQRL